MSGVSRKQELRIIKAILNILKDRGRPEGGRRKRNPGQDESYDYFTTRELEKMTSIGSCHIGKILRMFQERQWIEKYKLVKPGIDHKGKHFSSKQMGRPCLTWICAGPNDKKGVKYKLKAGEAQLFEYFQNPIFLRTGFAGFTSAPNQPVDIGKYKVYKKLEYTMELEAPVEIAEWICFRKKLVYKSLSYTTDSKTFDELTKKKCPKCGHEF